MPYFVYLKDSNGEIHSTVCGDDELKTLVSNMRKDLRIASVNSLDDDFRIDFVDFCEKNDNLEMGDNK